MPIKDANGTTYTDIKQILDANGTTYTNIAKVLDANGTTYSLIYSSDTIIIGNDKTYTSGWTKLSNGYVRSGTLTDNTSSITQKTSSGSYGNHTGGVEARSTATIDFTGFSTLYFTISNYTNGSKGRVGVSTIAQTGNGLNNYDIIENNTVLYKTTRNKTFTGNGTFSINISDLSGDYYIYLGLIATYSSGNPVGSVVYSNMYLV